MSTQQLGVALTVLVISLGMAATISALLGLGAAWVLGFFGAKVPWYACSVSIFILGCIFKAGAK